MRHFHILCLWIFGGLCGAEAQVVPRKMSVDKRFNMAHVDSVIREHLVYIHQLENTPKSIIRDTTLLNTMVYLSYLYFQTPHNRRDSSLLWSGRVVEEATRKKNYPYLIEAMTKQAEFLERFRANYQEAVQRLNKALLVPKINQRQYFFIKRMIGAIYAKTDNVNATAYIEKLIIEIKQSSISEKDKAQDLYNLNIAIAETNERKKNHRVSLRAYLSAVEEVKKFNQGIGLAYLYASIAQVYIELEEFDNTIKYIDEARLLFDKLKIPYDESINFVMARMHLKKQEYTQAAAKGEGIAQNIIRRKFKKFSNTNKEAHKILYDAYKGLGNSEKALYHLEIFTLIKDSLEQVKKAKEIDELIKKYDIERVKSENEKQLLEKNNQIQALKLIEYKNLAENQSLKEVLLQEKLEKEQVISQNQSKTLEGLRQKQNYETNLEKLKIQRLQEKLSLQEQNRNLWYGLALVSLSLLLAGTALFVYQSRQRYKFKQYEAEYQQRIAQTEIAALRAQMNPHFIFNCLNSIQYFAANNEAEVASEYLTKFSRLIRLVLENSRSEKVTLTNEIETLRLYLEMEAMRFGQKLTYAIETVPDTDIIQIPPLLIQPFVENAIWHGLMHKPEGGEVRIQVKQSDHQTLIVQILDNGIGRDRAAEIQSKSATKKKSFGMKVTSERIALINQLYRTQTQVQIIDLKDSNGDVLGTKVIVEIPI